MKNVFLALMLAQVTACVSQPSDSQDGFYTWIDASGQVRTEQRQPSPEQSDARINASSSNSDRTSSFDTSDFTPVDEVDKKLQGERLYAWIEDGRQQVMNAPSEPAQEPKDNAPSLNIQSQAAGLSDLSSFKKGKIWQYDYVLGRELKLADYYQFNKLVQRDYLLIDVFELQARSLTVRSFVSSGSLAYPHFVQLNKKLDVIEEKDIEWSGFNHESWASYGHLSGSLALHEDTAFLLILTRKKGGVMEVNDTVIKLVDLGSLEIAVNE